MDSVRYGSDCASLLDLLSPCGDVFYASPCRISVLIVTGGHCKSVMSNVSRSTSRVMGCAMRDQCARGPGLPESAYRLCLVSWLSLKPSFRVVVLLAHEPGSTPSRR